MISKPPSKKAPQKFALELHSSALAARNSGFRAIMNPVSNLEITENQPTHSVVFSVRVQPGASRDEISGVIEGALKVRLRAAAVENRANESLCEFLAGLLKRPKSAVRILSGDRSR